MLRTPTFDVDQSQRLILHIKQIKQTIIHWLKTFWKFSLFYGNYIANLRP